MDTIGERITKARLRLNMNQKELCEKILKDEIKASNTCRASFYIYNTKEEIDKLVDVLESRENIFDIIYML